jgi:dienelactone hydrolase
MSALTIAMIVLSSALADPPRETILYQANDTDQTAERFRLASHTFDVEREDWLDLAQSGITVTKIRFPSPVKSKHEINNTVHCEYYCPKNLTGKRPAVLVLDILDGTQRVSRGEAVWLAQHDIPALVMYMAYYGPRRPLTEHVRMLMPDIEHSSDAVRQTVLDARRAVAWLAVQPHVDAAKLGIVGTSLGSFLSGLTASAEPRITSACLLLTGGGLVEAFFEHPKARLPANVMSLLGMTKEQLAKVIDPLDPLTYAKQLKGKKLLLVVAKRDDVVPPSAAERLWKATGEQKIIWVDATHIGAVTHLFTAMNAVVEHLQP